MAIDVITPPGFLSVPPRFPTIPRQNRPNPAVPAYNRYMAAQPVRPLPDTRSARFNQGIFATGTPPFAAAPVTDDTIEMPGQLPEHKRARVSGWGEPVREWALDVEKIRSAIAAAARGETTRLFVIYKDTVLENSHVQAEFGKRKMSIIGQPHSIKPYIAKGQKKATAVDQKAADDIERMIEQCENWEQGLVHLMDAALWPVAVTEKIYLPNEDAANLPGIRFKFRRFDPVSYFAECFRLAYLAAGGFQLPSNIAPVIGPGAIPMQLNQPGDTIWDPDTWEPDLRFWRTLPNGMIDYSWASIYAPDPIRHMVHRSNILSRTIRDNEGGIMRAIIFWDLFMRLGRDWFAGGMARYGNPFMVGKANMQDVTTVELIKEAFRVSQVVGGILVNKDADIQLSTAVGHNIAQGHKIWMDFCKGEISTAILGHEGSSTAKAEGLNSNQEQSVEGASEMIRTFDQMNLKKSLERQLFRPYLDMNGQINAHAPNISWGGLSNEDLTALFDQIASAKQAGLQLTDDGIEHVNETSGIEFERAPEPEPAMAGNGKPGQPSKKTADE